MSVLRQHEVFVTNCCNLSGKCSELSAPLCSGGLGQTFDFGIFYIYRSDCW